MPMPRKPTALKLLEGNPGKRPLNELEPKPELSTPERPDHLGLAAKAEWDRIVPELEKLGLLTQVDRAALAAYCVAWGRHVEAEWELKGQGLTIKSPNGYPQPHPLLAISNKNLDIARRFMQEFGLTPASRSKVTVTPPEDDDDGFFTRRN